jgi:hypothetical protein
MNDEPHGDEPQAERERSSAYLASVSALLVEWESEDDAAAYDHL